MKQLKSNKLKELLIRLLKLLRLMLSTKKNTLFKKKLLKFQLKNKLLFHKKKLSENKFQFNKSLKRSLKKLLKFQKLLKSKKSLKRWLRNNKLLNSKQLFHNLSKSMKSLNNILTKSSPFQLFKKLLRKFQSKLKKLFKLCQQFLKLDKFQQSNKRLSPLINSLNTLTLSIILKEKFKLLIDSNKKKFQFTQQSKRLSKFLKFLKRSLRELSLCHKSLRSLNTSMRSMKMMVSESH